MNGNYPDRVDLVLPARLGNVIRAFETYTSRQYGMPAISLWPRLQAIVEGNLAQSLDGAKTSFDFMIHAAFLSGILAVVTAASGLYWKTRALPDLLRPWLAWTIVFGGISYLFYLASIPRAVEWGTQAKTAFDLYRLPLLLKLGYDLVAPLEDGSLQISLVVSNLDPTAWDADRVIVREEIPSAKLYVRDSATVNGAPAKLLSIDPLEIDLGPLPYYRHYRR